MTDGSKLATECLDHGHVLMIRYNHGCSYTSINELNITKVIIKGSPKRHTVQLEHIHAVAHAWHADGMRMTAVPGTSSASTSTDKLVETSRRPDKLTGSSA